MSYSLINLDLNNNDHLKFTYEILKFRYSKDYINLSGASLPTFDQHTSFLKDSNYMCFYLMSYKNNIFGEIFVDKESNIGIYQDRNIIKKIIANKLKSEKLYSPFCEPLLNKMVEKHNISFLKTSININNTMSINCAKKLKFIEVSRENNYINFERSFNE